MASFNNFLFLISLTSLLLTFTFATTDDVVSSQAPEVSTISSAPDSSPASAPSPYSTESTSSESAIAGEGDGLPETTVTEPIPKEAMSKEKQAKVEKLILATVNKVKEGADKFSRDVIAKKLNDPKTKSETRNCLTQCKKDFESTDKDINKVIEDLNAGDHYKAMDSVEGVSTFVDTCVDCLTELGAEDGDFKKFEEWVKGVTGDCVEQLSTINS